jgi:hypothetical protein
LPISNDRYPAAVARAVLPFNCDSTRRNHEGLSLCEYVL